MDGSIGGRRPLTPAEIREAWAERATRRLVPQPRIISGTLPVVSTPAEDVLSGWYSMLIDGAENPIFDSVTLINPPVQPTDAVSKQYVDASEGGIVTVLPGGDIQAALDGLPATGGTILLSANTTYVVTKVILSSTNNVHLSAPGWSTVIQRGPTLGGIMLQLLGSGCLIEGMTYDGNGTVNTGGQCEVQVAGPNSRITNVQVIRSAATNNMAATGADNRVDHCTIIGLGIDLGTERGGGIFASQNGRVTIDHNTITGTGLDALSVSGIGAIIESNTLINCRCYRGGPGGQLVVYGTNDPSASSLIANNIVIGGGSPATGGIEAYGHNLTIIGNTILNQFGSAIGIGTATPPGPARGVVITGNHVVNVGLDGSGSQDGISISAGATDFVICGNRISDDHTPPNMRWAITVQAGASDRYVITGNQCGPGTDLNNPIADGGAGLIKTITGNIGGTVNVPYTIAAAATYLPVGSVFDLLTPGGPFTITSLTGLHAAGAMKIALPNASFTFQAGNNIKNTVTTTPNIPLLMTSDENGNWWLSTPNPVNSAMAAMTTAATEARYNNPRLNAAMAAPPVITDNAAATGTLTNVVNVQTSAVANQYGGVPTDDGFGYNKYPSVTFSGTYSPFVWRVEVVADAVMVEFQIFNTGASKIRFIVDGNYVSKTVMTPLTAGNIRYIRLDFTTVGGRARRVITMEANKSTDFRTVAVGATETVTRASGKPPRMFIVGDSLAQATGTTNDFNGYAPILADLLGIKDVWNNGVGGTGFLANSIGAQLTFRQRLSDMVTATPDLILICGGLNDSAASPAALTAEVTAYLSAIRATVALATVPIVMMLDANNSPLASMQPLETAMSSAMAAFHDPQMFFIPNVNDPNGPCFTGTGYTGAPTGVGNSDVYIGADNIHPNDAGHAYMAGWIADAIRRVVFRITNQGTAPSPLNSSTLATSSAGLTTGTIWNNGGFLCVA